MKPSLSYACKNLQPRFNPPMLSNIPRYFRRKEKVVFVIGPTGTGKSRLAIDLATRFPAEIINCDKIQVHRGLDIVTNKVTKEECRGIPHHLLGTVDPRVDFTAYEFSLQASKIIQSLGMIDRLPIVAGGSTSYIHALAIDDPQFQMKYDCCFLWVDVSLPVLNSFVSKRVDRMVKAGLVDEVRQMYDFNSSDYSTGIRRAIGVPELDYFFRSEAFMDAGNRQRILESAISTIKENTCILAYHQLQKIHRLHSLLNWNVHRIDATEVFMRSGEDAEEAWEKFVAGPSASIVAQFLRNPALVPSLVPVVKAGLPSSARALAAPVAARR